MVPWSHLRQPSSGWVSTVLNSEFTHFNSVIRLSNVQQLAFPFCTFCDVPRFRLSFMNPVNAFSIEWSHFELPETSVFCSNVCSESASSQDIWIRQAHVLQVWYSSFWWLSGEVKHFCASNSMELESRFMPLWLTGTRACCGTIARTVGLGTGSCFLINCFGFVWHQLVPHWSLIFPRVPLRNVLLGLGVCAVFVRSVSPCRLVLEVRLFPSPPALFWPSARRVSAFFFLLPFRVDPAPAGCVCV